MSIGHNMYRDNSPGATTVLIEMIFGAVVIIIGASAWVAARLSGYVGLAMIRCWIWGVSIITSYAAFIWLSGFGLVSVSTPAAVAMVVTGALSMRAASHIAYRNANVFSSAVKSLTYQTPNVLRHKISHREPVTIDGEYQHER